MIAFLIVIGFVLAVLAHVKLYLFQKVLLEMHNERPAVVGQVITEAHVVPDRAPAAHIEATVLQEFYKLDEIQRHKFFHSIIGQINANSYASLHLACFSASVLERASNFQKTLYFLNQEEVSRLKAVLSASAAAATGPATAQATGPASAASTVPASTVPASTVPAAAAASVAVAPGASLAKFEAKFEPLPMTDSENDLMPSKASITKKPLDDSTAMSVTQMLESKSSAVTSSETNETTAAVDTKPTTRRNTKRKAPKKPASQDSEGKEEWRNIDIS